MITDRFKLAFWKLRLIQVYMLCAVSMADVEAASERCFTNPDSS